MHRQLTLYKLSKAGFAHKSMQILVYCGLKTISVFIICLNLGVLQI